MMVLAAPATAATVNAPPGPVLRDIHLPPSPSWWPPAPGWWALALLLVVVLLVLAWFWRRHRGVVKQRRGVLLTVDRLERQFRRDDDHATLAAGLQQLLRRVARAHDASAPRQRGQAWRQTLARVPVDAQTLAHLLALDEPIYRRTSAFDAAAAIKAVRHWLRLGLRRRAWKSAQTRSADA